MTASFFEADNECAQIHQEIVRQLAFGVPVCQNFLALRSVVYPYRACVNTKNFYGTSTTMWRDTYRKAVLSKVVMRANARELKTRSLVSEIASLGAREQGKLDRSSHTTFTIRILPNLCNLTFFKMAGLHGRIYEYMRNTVKT